MDKNIFSKGLYNQLGKSNRGFPFSFDILRKEGYTVVMTEETFKDEVTLVVKSINNDQPVYSKRYSTAEYYEYVVFRP